MEPLYRGFTICKNCRETCHSNNDYCEDCANELFEAECGINEQLNDQIADLEAKLAEYQKERLNCSQIENGMSLCIIQKSEIAQLKQQLAEKDKEIETTKKDSDKNIDYLVEFASLIENEKDCNRMLKALERVKRGNKYLIDKDHNQDKIALLEKVKEFCDNPKNQVDYEYYTDCWTTAVDKDSLLNKIDTLIKEIKGE